MWFYTLASWIIVSSFLKNCELLFSVLEVNVVATDNAEDLVFPKKEDLRGSWKEAPDTEIRLSRKAIQELGVDG